MLQSPIGQIASRSMMNIETFPSKQMYFYLSLVERKVAEFYLNLHGLVKLTDFHECLETNFGDLVKSHQPDNAFRNTRAILSSLSLKYPTLYTPKL